MNGITPSSVSLGCPGGEPARFCLPHPGPVPHRTSGTHGEGHLCLCCHGNRWAESPTASTGCDRYVHFVTLVFLSWVEVLHECCLCLSVMQVRQLPTCCPSWSGSCTVPEEGGPHECSYSCPPGNWPSRYSPYARTHTCIRLRTYVRTHILAF